MKDLELYQHWERIIDTMHDGLMVVNPDGTLRAVNRAFERMTGYRAREVTGKPCTLLNCDACETTLKEGKPWWCNLFEKGEVVRRRCVVMKKDGTYLPALKNATLLRDPEGKPIGAVETLTDISELERLDRAVGQLSHEMGLSDGFHGLIGRSSAMQKIYEVIEKAAQSDAPVILYGESGTGKELAARAVHDLGREFVHQLWVAGERGPLSSSIARPSTRPCWRASSSAT